MNQDLRLKQGCPTDVEMGMELRTLMKNLNIWHEKATKNKLNRVDMQRMKEAADSLRIMINNREL